MRRSGLAGWKAGVAAVLIAAVFGVAAAPAGAAGDLVVEVDGGGPIFQISNFYPGAETSTVVRVRNAGSADGVLSVRSVSIVDEDHCSPVELRTEMPCGTGRGDLGEQIELALDLVGDGADQTVWEGSVYDLEDGVTLADPLPAAGPFVTYRFSAHLPVTSGNEAQMDALGFGVRFELEGQGTTEVAGMVLGTAESQSTRFLGLTIPMTGWPLAVGAASALLLATSGGVLMVGRTRLRAV